MASPEIPYFKEITGQNESFPWQKRLYERLCAGDIPKGVDIPTGLGKTTCTLIYILAKAFGAPLPTRLVYVVDRRAIVDQTAETIRNWVAKINDIPELSQKYHNISALPAPYAVAVGILRGGLADDGEWRTDPTRPAVVVGTVDMIGSRLLFSGYGDGISRRSMHAGLLGHDATVFLDEAHLSPAMHHLLRNIEKLQRNISGMFCITTLSATGVGSDIVPLSLEQDDYCHRIVKQRLEAVKRPYWVKTTNKVNEIVKLAQGFQTGSVVIFSYTVKEAKSIELSLTKALGRERVILLTGTLRGKERGILSTSPVWKQFSPSRDRSNKDTPSVFLVSTSAGEVGVDIDADHGVMDLTTLDSMIQRMGRINRVGMTISDVHVVYAEKELKGEPAEESANLQEISEEENSESSKVENKGEMRRKALFATHERLKKFGSLAPAAFREINADDLKRCSISSIKMAPFRDDTAERLSLTGAEVSGPPVDIFLRGVDEPKEPDTFLLWRREVPLLAGMDIKVVEDAVTFFPPLPEELARVSEREAKIILEKAIDRANTEGRKLDVIIRDARGEVTICPMQSKEDIPAIGYATIFLSPQAGGLDQHGFPDPNAKDIVADVGDTDNRHRYLPDEPIKPEAKGWNFLRLPTHSAEEDDTDHQWLIYAVFKKGSSFWDADSDLTRLAANNQTIIEHNRRVGEVVRKISRRLHLAPELLEAMGMAGDTHDLGKGAKVWQRAAGVPKNSPPMAKSRADHFQPELLGGYRHEFGTLAELERSLDANTPQRDLILHLVAAHHGRARPGFADPRQWSQEFPDIVNRKIALDVTSRFGRLQGQFGPWRLAWLESLLKAADAAVSSDRDGIE